MVSGAGGFGFGGPGGAGSLEASAKAVSQKADELAQPGSLRRIGLDTQWGREKATKLADGIKTFTSADSVSPVLFKVQIRRLQGLKACITDMGTCVRLKARQEKASLSNSLRHSLDSLQQSVKDGKLDIKNSDWLRVDPLISDAAHRPNVQQMDLLRTLQKLDNYHGNPNRANLEQIRDEFFTRGSTFEANLSSDDFAIIGTAIDHALETNKYKPDFFDTLQLNHGSVTHNLVELFNQSTPLRNTIADILSSRLYDYI
ncbi:hypothetical protein ACFL96_03760 [Thermoproteota archaeon]